MTEPPAAPTWGSPRPSRARTTSGWRLYGRKWFTSAIASQMALTLARPEGNPAGREGPRALLRRDARRAGACPTASGSNRLKDKLGTRKVPTAELTLDGTPRDARRRKLRDGVKQHRADAQRHAHLERVSAVALMRRGHRARARLRAPPRRVRRAARREAAAPRHARGHAGRVTRPRSTSRSSSSSSSGGAKRGRRAPSSASCSAPPDADREARHRASRRSRCCRR